jgi:hypothetical protein
VAPEGRALWGSLVRHSRDWTRLAMTHFPPEIRGRAARYIQVDCQAEPCIRRQIITQGSCGDETTCFSSCNWLQQLQQPTIFCRSGIVQAELMPCIRRLHWACVQVLAFVLKSHLRSGRTRASPNDPTAFKDDPTTVVRYHTCRVTELLSTTHYDCCNTHACLALFAFFWQGTQQARGTS